MHRASKMTAPVTFQSVIVWAVLLLALGATVTLLRHGPGLWSAVFTRPVARPFDETAVDVTPAKLAIAATPRSGELALRKINVIFYAPRLPPAPGGSTSPMTSSRISSGQPSIPVVIFLPGWGGRAGDVQILPAKLAADGFLVVAIDDIAHDEPLPGQTPEQRAARVSVIDLTDANGLDSFKRNADIRTQMSAAKLSSVLDALIASAKPAGTIQQHQVVLDQLRHADTKRVAAVGFSFGGSTALEALVTDERIRAAINLDGWVFGTAADKPVKKPYLAFVSTNSAPPVPLGHARANEIAMNTLSDARHVAILAQPGNRRVEISGTLHGDYSDALHGHDRWREWRPWKPPLANPDAVRSQIDRHVLGFLRSALSTQEGLK